MHHHQVKWGYNTLCQKGRQLKLGFYVHLDCHTIALRAMLQICPVAALKECLKLVPGVSNAPLFQFKLYGTWVPMTDTTVRKHLKNSLSLLGKDTSLITFLSFRRSGAPFAFNHNVPLQEKQRHGTWTSECVWRYITNSIGAGTQVALTVACLIS